MITQTQTIPPWRPIPPSGGKIGPPIGKRTGQFRVWEITVYFDYISGKGESQERHFEFTMRIPLTKKNSKRNEMYWEFMAMVKMESMNIHISGHHWDEGIVGDRYTGRTDAYKPRYCVVNKKTDWCSPEDGGWGVLRGT